MNYEVVELKEKVVAGLSIRTCNTDENMGMEIGKTWTDFFAKGVYTSIPNKVNENSIGLYTNYEKDFTGKYDMLVCAEVMDNDNLPEGVATAIIPTGKYAKFIVKGDAQKAVVEFWGKLWGMNLDRAYTSDFEEYQAGSEDMKNSEIHIYISLK